MVPFSLLLIFLLLPVSTSSLPSGLTRILRSSGYSLSAATLSSACRAAAAPHPRHRNFLHGWNFTGTLFLPVDSSLENRRLASLFLYHAARLPPLRFSDLSSLPPGSPIPTFSHRCRCLFVRRTSSGVPCLGTSYGRRHHRSCVSILHPDLFLTRDLAVHGIDGILDPAAAARCHSGTTWRAHSHLARAVRNLRRRGYAGVAGEMEHLSTELAMLPAVTVFAPRGHVLPRGYDLRHYVAPRRYRLLELKRVPEGRRIGMLASNSTVVIGKAASGGVTANGISVDGKELFRNGWAVVFSISRMFPISDDVADQVSEEVDYPGFAGNDHIDPEWEPRPGAPSPALGGGELLVSTDEYYGEPVTAVDDEYRRRLGGTAYQPRW